MTIPCDTFSSHAAPWRRGAAKPQDGCGVAAAGNIKGGAPYFVRRHICGVSR